MSKFKVGDRVRVVMPVDRKDNRHEGALGTVTRESIYGNGLYFVKLDNPDLSCPNWSEPFLEYAFELGTLVEVTGYGVAWNGAVGSVYMTDATGGIYIRLVEKYGNFDIGTQLHFRRDQLSPTSIPVEEETPAETPVEKSKQEQALVLALLAFEFYAEQHEAKGKTKKARTNRILADMMQEALNDFE